MTNEANENVLRNQADDLILQDLQENAMAVLEQVWRLNPGIASSGFIRNRFQQIKEKLGGVVRCKIALLRSFTIEPIIPLLEAACAVGKIDTEIYIGQYNAYQSEILDTHSALYKFEPNIIILAINIRDLNPLLWSQYTSLSTVEVASYAESIIEGFKSWLNAIRSQSTASIIVHGLETPTSASNGIYDAQTTNSQFETIREINIIIAKCCRSISGVYFLDYDALVSRHGKEVWHDAKKWELMRVPISSACSIYLAKEWIKFIYPILGRVVKCLVLDLDNTLWGGIVGEDGIEGIKIGIEYPGSIYRSFQQAIIDASNRGIILAICSKNNLSDVMEVFDKNKEMLIKENHIACFRVNWNNKAQNLIEIAKELNIGIDSLGFIDDNPAERQMIRQNLPDVMVLEIPDDPSQYEKALRDWPFVQRITLTTEDRERGKLYIQDRIRTELSKSSNSIEDFYWGMEQKIEVGCVTPTTITRVSQLTQKTNQFNLTTRRYTEQEIEKLCNDPNWLIRWVRVQDKFGDNGITGIIMIKKIIMNTWEIDNFLLSCRIIGRTIETAILSVIIDEIKQMGATKISGIYIPTKKNVPAKDIYHLHNFKNVIENNGEVRWELNLNENSIIMPPWISQINPTKEK